MKRASFKTAASIAENLDRAAGELRSFAIYGPQNGLDTDITMLGTEANQLASKVRAACLEHCDCGGLKFVARLVCDKCAEGELFK